MDEFLILAENMTNIHQCQFQLNLKENEFEPSMNHVSFVCHG